MTYADALAFWYARINYEVRSATPSDLKLERMRALMALAGNPHERARTVHLSDSINYASSYFRQFTTVQGESRDKTILKLRDNAPGFDNPVELLECHPTQ